MVRVFIILLLVALQAAFGAPDYLLGTEHYWLRALSYSFFHANWWHLAVNCIAVWSIPSRRWLKTLLWALLIATLVYPLSFRPVIGFSNVLFAVIGLHTPSLKSQWWKQTPVIVFFIVNVALFFVPQFSATTHIAAFLLGALFASIGRYSKDLFNDFRRYL